MYDLCRDGPPVIPVVGPIDAKASFGSGEVVSIVTANLTLSLWNFVEGDIGNLVRPGISRGGPPPGGRESDADTAVGVCGGPVEKVEQVVNIVEIIQRLPLCACRGLGQGPVRAWQGLVVDCRELEQGLLVWPRAPHFHGTYT